MPREDSQEYVLHFPNILQDANVYIELLKDLEYLDLSSYWQEDEM